MESKRALVLTGGGARGAYQAGVLKFLAENIEDPQFKIMLGSSAGALNVATLASGSGSFRESVAEMEKTWSSLRIHDVLRIDFLSLLRMSGIWIFNLVFSGLTGHSVINSLIDSSPLTKLVLKIFKPAQVQAAINSGKLETLAITATEVSSASSVTFVQSKKHQSWKRSNRRSEATTLSHEHILASSAIPFLFKSVRIGNKQYLDGSVRSNTPLAPAARLGATEIFSIGVRRLNTDSPDSSNEMVEHEPTIAQIGGLVLNSLFSDSLDSDADHLKRINQLLEHVDPEVALRTAGMKPINVCMMRPSEDIGKIATEYTHRLPFFLRFLLRSLGSEKAASSDIVSYLLFDSSYAQRLIDMGYRDAQAQKDELLRFFSGSAKPPHKKVA